MSTSELLRVHERYFKVDEGSHGEGIGLALVKAYCDSEDIQIQIQSEKDVGTSVCLNLIKVHM
jgi:signal transduction histidine kinase